MLRFIWQVLNKVRPHGHTEPKIATAALPERTFAEGLTFVWCKTKHTKPRDNIAEHLTGYDEIVAVAADP
jgi:hypothetical protein